jgi:hypothetical protein
MSFGSEFTIEMTSIRLEIILETGDDRGKSDGGFFKFPRFTDIGSKKQLPFQLLQ